MITRSNPIPTAILRPARAIPGWKAARAGIAGLAVIGLLAGGVAAQDDNGLIDEYAYQSPAHGYVVEWDDPWVPSLGGISHEPGHDAFTLGTPDGDLGFTGIALDWSPEEYAQVLVEGIQEVFEDGEVEIVEEGEVDGVYYALIEAEEDGIEWVSYVETRVLDPEDDGAQILVMTDVFAFAEDIDQVIEDVIDEVEIDGGPAFTALDETDLEERYEADEADEDEEDEEDRDDEDRNDVDENDGDDEDRDDDETGLIQDTLYVSPSHGYVVRWSDFFAASPDETRTIDELDQLSLYTTDAMIRVMGTTAAWTPEDIVDLFVEDFLAAGGLEIADLGVEDGVAFAVLEHESGDDDEAKIYVEARPFDQATDLDGEGVIVTTLLTTDERFDDTLALAAEEIEIDGNPVFDLIEVADEDDDRDDGDDRDDADDEDRDDEDRGDDDDRDQDDRDDAEDEDVRDDDRDDEADDKADDDESDNDEDSDEDDEDEDSDDDVL